MNVQNETGRASCRHCRAPGCVIDDDLLLCGDCFFEHAIQRRAARSEWFARRRRAGHPGRTMSIDTGPSSPRASDTLF